MSNLISRRIFLAAAAALSLSLTQPTWAHEAPCPYCSQPITQDTTQQDNEVALKIGRKRIEYKCVFCALSEAATDYKGDLSILTPSEKKGEPIKLERTGDRWSASAPDVAFVAHRASHKICDVTYRAFTNTKAAQAYIAANKDKVGDANPIALAEMLEIAGGKK